MVGGVSGMKQLEPWFRAGCGAGCGTGPRTAGTADSAILIWLGGGPSHIDTFDPKPDAPLEIRGNFTPVNTNVPGIQLSQHLSKTARVMDKLCAVRSVTSPTAAHGTAAPVFALT